MRAYYNDIDPFCCEWLRNLIEAGLIADGDVDSRSITDVTADDLVGYTQCHFFAGVGAWSLALRNARWADDRQVWTGSCPCQPFSAAGKQKGQADKRHLWPEFARLIRECRPPVVFGEQVEGAVRLGWLDGVFGDLEDEGYACGAVVLGAHSVGAPHIRQRLYWVGESNVTRPQQRNCSTKANGHWSSTESASVGIDRLDDSTDPRHAQAFGEQQEQSSGRWRVPSDRSDTDGLADTQRDGGRFDESQRGPEGRTADRRTGTGLGGDPRSEWGCSPQCGGCSVSTCRGSSARLGWLGDTNLERQGSFGGVCGGERADCEGGSSGLGHSTERGLGVDGCAQGDSGHTTQPDADGWSDCTTVHCRDGKARRISAQPGDEPLAYGIPVKLGPSLAPLRHLAKDARRNRVGRLRAYGNAIVPQLATEFIRAYMESIY